MFSRVELRKFDNEQRMKATKKRERYHERSNDIKTAHQVDCVHVTESTDTLKSKLDHDLKADTATKDHTIHIDTMKYSWTQNLKS